HLVAEIVENATTFSPEDTQVYVSGQPLSSGGVLLDISDSGVGISEQEMAHANWRLDNPPVVDVGVSRRMGLFVVGRLAARHGVRVRLRHAPSGGLTALVWLPDTVATQEGASLGRLRRFEPEDYGSGPSLSAPPAGGSGGALPTRQGFNPAGGAAAAQAAAAARIPRFSPPSTTAPQPAVGAGPQPPLGPANGGRGGFGTTMPGQGAPQMPGVPQMPGAAPANGYGAPGTPGGAVPGGFGGRTGSPAGPEAPASPMPPQPATPGPGAESADGGVRVPAPPETGHDQRLPIFDSLESDWFRRSGTTHTAQDAGGAQLPDGGSWNSPADEGWRAAQTVAAPTTGTQTSAGLPRRVPRANLVPGSIGDPAATGGGPSRSAEEVRSRLASFQRGVREARAASPKNEEP
ncbi:MAG TPA: ATP-binding protein, partial [Streptosporangiaceae bacterium]|nr:ATP-binding protein [Streptosporangiaceae bacterium]